MVPQCPSAVIYNRLRVGTQMLGRGLGSNMLDLGVAIPDVPQRLGGDAAAGGLEVEVFGEHVSRRRCLPNFII